MFEIKLIGEVPADTRARDIVLRAFVWGTALVVAATFVWLVGNLVWHGTPSLSWSFLTSAPTHAGRGGGIAPILVSTILTVGVAIVVAAPLALGTAALLSEFSAAGGRVARLASLSLDVLAGVPSIVFGLFGNALFCVWLGLGFSILSGSLTLACMALPLMVRTAEQGLRMVPDEWRRAAAALGMSRTAILWHVLIPAATPALAAGLVLGIGRAMAETAALIFTSGYVDRMPASLWDSGRALSVHIYDLTMNVAGGDPNAYASALVLIALLTLVNSAALWLADAVLQRRISLG